MNKTVLIIVVVIIVVLGGWYLYSKLYKAPSSSSSNSSSQSVASNTVSIQNMAFGPSNITVKKGTTVTWTNKDSVGHTVTETDGQSGPSSATLNQNQTYSFTFNAVGTFQYHCSIHPYMTGSVTVTQ